MLKILRNKFFAGACALALVFVFAGTADAAADIAIASSKITSANTVLVTLTNPGQNIASVDATKWHIDAVDGGGSSLTPASATITSAGTPWTITLTFSGTPFSDTAKTYTAATGLYVDALGVTDANTPGDTNAVVGHAASTPITDGQVPVISSFTYEDSNVDGKIDSIRVTYSESVVAGSVMGASDLTFTSVGDFTGAAFGPLATDLITGTVANTSVPLGTASTAKDTRNDGTIAISTQALFSLVDAAGNTNATLGAQAQATFVDSAKPQIKTFTYRDANGNGMMDTIDVAYTEPVQGASVLGANDLNLTNVGDFTNAAFGALATDLITVDGVTSTTVPLGTPTTVSSTKELSGNIAISTKVLFSLLDTSGNNNTTLGAQAVNATFVDGIKPTVTSTVPVSASTAQSKTNPITVVFGEAMDPTTLTLVMSPVNVPHTAVWSVGNTTLTLSHTQYVGSTTYNAMFVNLADVAGNTLAIGADNYDWSFTTATGTSRSSSSGGSSSSTPATPATPTVTPATPATPAVTAEVPGCSGGNMFNTSTGKPCVNNTGNVKKIYNLGTVTLKNGSKGEAVVELQKYLNEKLNLGLVLDGKLGPKTIAVIKQWQASKGLVADGLIGPKTKAMINVD